MVYDRNIPNSSRRSGGREARRSIRSVPLARDLRPVRAGLEGGQFKPLSAASVKSINVKVYQILEEIGLSKAPESGIKYMTDAGVQVMKDVCMGGPGHYLGHDQTITLMQTAYVYPEISDRSSPKEWEELGKPNLLEAARKRKEHILQNSYPNHISKELDAELRSRFEILL